MSEQGPYPGGYPGASGGQPPQQPAPPSYPQGPGYPPAPQQQPYGYAYPPLPGSGRPGRLTGAAVITWVGSGLMLLMFVLMVIGGLALSGAEFEERLRDEVGSVGVSIDQIRGWVIGIGVIGTIWCALACVVAGLMLKRQNWARVVLAVSASATILFSLMAITAVFPVLFTAAAIAVLVMIFNGEVNAWFRGEQYGGGYPPYQPQAWPPYGQQPPPPPAGQHGPW